MQSLHESLGDPQMMRARIAMSVTANNCCSEDRVDPKYSEVKV